MWRGITRLRTIGYPNPADAIEDLVFMYIEMERAVRVRVWNDCKSRGLKDDAAYPEIRAEVERIIASAIEARRAATTKIDAVEDESAIPQGDAQ